MGPQNNSSVPALTTTRRQAVGAVAAVMGTLAAGSFARGFSQQNMTEAQSTGTEGLLTYLHQEVEIKASAQRIYDALLDAKQFSGFSGMPAEINREAGGAFSMFGGRIVGRNIELVPAQRIVQAWRPASWDPGIYSIVRFEFKERGRETTVVLDHTGFPEGNFRHLDSGWYLRYWDPLKKFLG